MSAKREKIGRLLTQGELVGFKAEIDSLVDVIKQHDIQIATILDMLSRRSLTNAETGIVEKIIDPEKFHRLAINLAEYRDRAYGAKQDGKRKREKPGRGSPHQKDARASDGPRAADGA